MLYAVGCAFLRVTENCFRPVFGGILIIVLLHLIGNNPFYASSLVTKIWAVFKKKINTQRLFSYKDTYFNCNLIQI